MKIGALAASAFALLWVAVAVAAVAAQRRRERRRAAAAQIWEAFAGEAGGGFTMTPRSVLHDASEGGPHLELPAGPLTVTAGLSLDEGEAVTRFGASLELRQPLRLQLSDARHALPRWAGGLIAGFLAQAARGARDARGEILTQVGALFAAEPLALDLPDLDSAVVARGEPAGAARDLLRSPDVLAALRALVAQGGALQLTLMQAGTGPALLEYREPGMIERRERLQAVLRLLRAVAEELQRAGLMGKAA